MNIFAALIQTISQAVPHGGAANVGFTGNFTRIPVLPDGEFNSHDGRPANIEGSETSVWRLDAVLAAALIERFEATGLDLVIDYEHQTLKAEDNGQPAPAAGWITKLEYTPGAGLFAVVRWTPQAKAALESQQYLYISPVFAFDAKSGAVTLLAHAALTNTPGLQSLPPLTALAAQHLVKPTPKETETMNIKVLLAALGIAETATQDEAVSAIAALKAQTPPTPAAAGGELQAALSAKTIEVTTLQAKLAALQANQFDPVRHIPMEEHKKTADALAALSAQVEGAEQQTLLQAALSDGRILPASEAYWVKQPVVALKEYLKDAQPIAALAGQQTAGKASNSASGAAGATLTETELAVCKQLGLTSEQFLSSKTGAAK